MASSTYDLSIVIPTRNRDKQLQQLFEAIPAACGDLSYQVVVVDGASKDGTSALCDEAKSQWKEHFTYIREDEANGFVKAANLGFQASEGKFLTWINDDARPLPGCYPNAIRQLEKGPEDIGLLALFSPLKTERSVAYRVARQGQTYKVMHIRGTLYANFGLGKRTTFELLGYYDEQYFICGADPDFSLKVWSAGLRIVPAYDALIDHDEEEDDTRASSFDYRSEDNAKLFAKWDLPPVNPDFNDFDPMNPCTIRIKGD